MNNLNKIADFFIKRVSLSQDGSMNEKSHSVVWHPPDGRNCCVLEI